MTRRNAIVIKGQRDSKPFRDRTVRVMGVVECPTCGAFEGGCVTTAGAPQPNAHRPRRALALRLQREQEDFPESA